MNINFNGKIFPADQPIFTSQNRAFLYGDALFETIKMSAGKILFFENHLERLFKGLHYFQYRVPKKYLSPTFFEKEIRKIASGNARIRLTVFRTNGGLYTPTNNRPQFLIETTPLQSSGFSLNKKGLQLGIFEDIKLSCAAISNLKTCNSSPYILAGLNKKVRNLDDVIMLNEKDRISEASSSNIFLIKKNNIITPALSEGCIEGTMRKTILNIALELGYTIHENPIKVHFLKNVEEIWLTNAISGIKWVAQIEQLTPLLKSFHAQTFVERLNRFY